MGKFSKRAATSYRIIACGAVLAATAVPAYADEVRADADAVSSDVADDQMEQGDAASGSESADNSDNKRSFLSGGGRLLLTGGVSTIEGAGGGGLVPWALIGGYGTRNELGLSAFATGVDTKDFTLNVSLDGRFLPNPTLQALAHPQFRRALAGDG